MKKMENNRRDFLKNTLGGAAGMVLSSAVVSNANAVVIPYAEPRIRFSVVGINHNHIFGMVDAVTRGGGQLVAVYAKEKDLLETFTKRYPQVKVAADEKEILEDKSIQLVLSSGIASERAPLGIRVMKSGKDFLSDKPGITTLEQLEAVRKVQKETKRIYSILFSERFENRATVKAGELVKAGAIGKVVQTIGMGPHRIKTTVRP
ncbi:MAG: Gfo/Idh/MocA family protein, partial [Spirosomataceae bacterium]